MNEKIVNWNTLLTSSNDFVNFTRFKNGEMSGKALYQKYANTNRGGEVRSLLRSGVVRAKDLARKALSRRQANI